MKRNYLFVLFILFGFGCYPGGPEYVDELDVVYTNYDESFNFVDTYTYSLPPGVIDINERVSANDPPEFIDDEFGNAILNEVRANMNALGWTEVDEDENPDIIMLASAFSTSTYYYYDPGWWWWYYPGYAPGWGWGYPGYFPGYVTGYTTGTVLIQMTDPNAISGDEVPVVWTCAFNGLLQGSDANIISRIESNIDQAFTHNPF